MIADDDAEPAAAARRRERVQVGQGRHHHDSRSRQLEPHRARRARGDRRRTHRRPAHARRRRGALHDRRPRMADRARRRFALGRAQSGARADVGGRRLHQADRYGRRADERRRAGQRAARRPTSSPRRSKKRIGTACASRHTRSARRASRMRCARASIRSSTARCSTTNASRSSRSAESISSRRSARRPAFSRISRMAINRRYIVEKARGLNEAMLSNIRRAYENGVRIAGGSDAGTPYNYHENYAQEVELMWALLGMTPQQALHAATNVAAELVGLHQRHSRDRRARRLAPVAARRGRRRARAARTAARPQERPDSVAEIGYVIACATSFSSASNRAGCRARARHRRCHASRRGPIRCCSASRYREARFVTSSCSFKRTARSTISSRHRFSRTAVPIRAPTRRKRPWSTASPCAFEPVPFEYPADPRHSHRALVGEWDRGKMDGFAKNYVTTRAGHSNARARFFLRVPPRFGDDALSLARGALRARRRELCAAARSDVPEPLRAGDGANPHRRQPQRRRSGAATRSPARPCRSSARANR